VDRLLFRAVAGRPIERVTGPTSNNISPTKTAGTRMYDVNDPPTLCCPQDNETRSSMSQETPPTRHAPTRDLEVLTGRTWLWEVKHNTHTVIYYYCLFMCLWLFYIRKLSRIGCWHSLILLHNIQILEFYEGHLLNVVLMLLMFFPIMFEPDLFFHYHA